MDGVILLLYVLTFGSILIYTAGLDLRELRFADGIFIGLLFFIFIPLLIAFVDGEIASIDMRAGPFRPLRDTATSLQLCIGAGTLMLFHWLGRHSGRIIPRLSGKVMGGRQGGRHSGRPGVQSRVHAERRLAPANGSDKACRRWSIRWRRPVPPAKKALATVNRPGMACAAAARAGGGAAGRAGATR